MNNSYLHHSLYSLVLKYNLYQKSDVCDDKGLKHLVYDD